MIMMYIILYINNRLGGLMSSLLVSSVVDSELERMAGQTKDF